MEMASGEELASRIATRKRGDRAETGDVSTGDHRKALSVTASRDGSSDGHNLPNLPDSAADTGRAQI